MALDSRYVDRIFARLLVRYGAAWMRMWEGVDMEAVKADWGNELDRISAESIAYAIDHLPPEKPPTVAQFRGLCVARTTNEYVALPSVKANPERVREIVANLGEFQAQHPKAWAHRLKEREERGDPLSSHQKSCWRAALAGEEVAE